MIVVKQHVMGIILFFRMSKNELLEKTPDALRYGKDHFPHQCKWLTAEVGDVSFNEVVTLMKYFDYGAT